MAESNRSPLPRMTAVWRMISQKEHRSRFGATHVVVGQKSSIGGRIANFNPFSNIISLVVTALAAGYVRMWAAVPSVRTIVPTRAGARKRQTSRALQAMPQALPVQSAAASHWAVATGRVTLAIDSAERAQLAHASARDQIEAARYALAEVLGGLAGIMTVPSGLVPDSPAIARAGAIASNNKAVQGLGNHSIAA